MASTPSGPPPPDPRTLADDLHRAIALLIRTKAEGAQWSSAAELSARLRDEFGIRLHWRTIETLLSADRRLVERRKRERRWEFAVMEPGRELVMGQVASVQVVDPERAVPAVVSLHSLLAGLTGTIRICDPYVDPSTVEHLDKCPPGVSIRLLTQNVREYGPLKRLVVAARSTRPFEIRVSTAKLHDRYVIDDTGMFLLGTSLNGFGKRQSFVTKAGSDIRGVVVRWFDDAWNRATPLT